MNVKKSLPSSLDGRYTCLRYLADGAMARVYLARDNFSGKDIALKVYDQEVRREWIARELAVLEAVHHPGLVRSHGLVSTTTGQAALALAFISGETLLSKMRTCHLTLSEVVNVVWHLADVLDSLHAVGVIHRDVKPQNIMLSAEGRGSPIVLIDPGLAKIIGKPPVEKLTDMVGTPRYLAPEVVWSCEVTSQVDLYALGVVMYEMLTGVSPLFSNGMPEMFLEIATKNPIPLNSLNSDIPEALNDIVMSLLSKNPADRYTASQLRSILETLPSLVWHHSSTRA